MSGIKEEEFTEIGRQNSSNVKYNDENENIVKRENILFELTVLSWTSEWYSFISTLRDSTF